MTTQTETEEVHLVNIITVAEDKLQSNFRNILNRFRKTDDQFANVDNEMKKIQKRMTDSLSYTQAALTSSINSLNDKVQKCFELIHSLSRQSGENTKQILGCRETITKNQKEFQDLINMVEEKIGTNQNEVENIAEKLNKAQSDIYQAYEQILKKQDSTQVLKICKDIQGTKQKVCRTEKQYKLLEHKLEKIEINNQKTQRNQSKKEIELMRQIEDRIKKQLKTLQRNIPNIGNSSRHSSPGLLGSSFGTNNNERENSQAQKDSISPQKSIKAETLGSQDFARMSFQMEEEDMTSLVRNNFQKNSIIKINEKQEAFEAKLKSIEALIHNIATNNKKSNKPQSEEIKERINEIKPELIKIWAKCDALDDRIAFNQRKIEDKTKTLNNLLEAQRQNGVGRVDQKLKLFQTQIYASLKQLKTKVEAKVNSQDYEKHTLALDQRLRQMNELIYMKSDKLQVKKALLFLESKIKQIILVISEDQQNQKDALLTKKQLKCISCDKDIDKISKFASTTTARGNWDAMPFKEHSPELLGKFGMTGFGSLSKKLKKMESKDLPVLKSKKTANSVLQPIVNTIPQSEAKQESK